VGRAGKDKILVPKKGLSTALCWNLPVLLVKLDLGNGLHVAREKPSRLSLTP
jgi:hypothetical protein